ncbi:MAG TPA: MerR family transcriptional regulator [Acholeplasmataceae bacterium]|nr:MerR family transcriptional regulator [Acholeplasmataceae bacterium]
MNYKISELAKLAGISTRTLRHYDDIGLLVPIRIKDSNYRIYDETSVNQLQHILILKEMGFELEHIKKMIKNIDSTKRMHMLEDHLSSLETKKKQIDAPIHNVSTTMKEMKGEIKMKNQDKFEGLKNKMVSDNDALYKDEVIERWGKDAYESSRKAFKNFTKEQFDYLNQLASDLIKTLIQVKKDPKNQTLKNEVFNLHQTWLTMSWGGTYNKEAHYNLVDMYVSDERFKKYYDQHEDGLAELLKNIVQEHLINDI